MSDALTKQDLLALRGDGEYVDASTHYQIVQFLHREARLLDEERLQEWFDLLTDDVVYWAPLRENRMRRDKCPEIDPARAAFFDETKATILMRIGRVESGMAWSEDPATRQVHVIGNVEAFNGPGANCFEVHSTFCLYRNRAERDDSTLFGRRRDVLVRCADAFRIKARLVLLQQATLLSKNLSSFF